MKKPRCSRCRYWSRPRGECRFNPPTRFERGWSHWPRAESDDWCGKFEAEEGAGPQMPLGGTGSGRTVFPVGGASTAAPQEEGPRE